MDFGTGLSGTTPQTSDDATLSVSLGLGRFTWESMLVPRGRIAMAAGIALAKSDAHRLDARHPPDCQSMLLVDVRRATESCLVLAPHIRPSRRFLGMGLVGGGASAEWVSCSPLPNGLFLSAPMGR